MKVTYRKVRPSVATEHPQLYAAAYSVDTPEGKHLGYVLKEVNPGPYGGKDLTWYANLPGKDEEIYGSGSVTRADATEVLLSEVRNQEAPSSQ